MSDENLYLCETWHLTERELKLELERLRKVISTGEATSKDANRLKSIRYHLAAIEGAKEL